jgi:hypothetical protein
MMAHGSADSRVGSGQVVAGSIRMPTNQIPCNCTCTWVVVKPGPGMECLSDLRYRNSICVARHTPALVSLRAVTGAS